MVSGPRRLKRESTVVGGLVTPVPSYRGSPAAVSPKREDSEIIDLASDEDGEDSKPHRKFEEEEDIYTDRDPRSPTVSAPPSRTPRQRAAPPASQQSQVSATTNRPPPSSQQSQASTLAPSTSSYSSSTDTMLRSSNPQDGNFAQGMGKVGKKVKLLVDGLSDLRKFDLEHVVELPELVLVGDQSAGKSSLMSALTEVQLPRGQGICTRCPANIKTTEADDWSCKVSLQQHYYYDGSRNRFIQPEHVDYKTNPFPPWVEQIPLQIKEFITITHKDDLEDAIKWAQIALLNHDDDHTLFVPGIGSRTLAPGSYEQELAKTTAKFSPNLIAIDISGPGLPALSFYDLPGLFQTAGERKDQYLKGVIDNLAIKYIGKANAMIIWALAMRGDPQTSTTSKVIMDFEASNRTMGVLTCPDHIHSHHSDFDDILRGKKYIMQHGYFVTKQPDANSKIPKDGNYHETARREEMDFFRGAPVWKDEWKEFAPRFGTKKIQEYLSRELARQIESGIPGIQEKIAARARSVDEKLAQIPELPDSNIRHTIKTLLAEFSSDVSEVMYGESMEDLTSQWGEIAKKFMDVIQYMKPTINIAHPSDRFQNDVIDLVDSDDDNASVASSPVNRKHDRNGNVPKGGSTKPVARAGPPVSPSTPRGQAANVARPQSGRVKNEFDFMPIPFPTLSRKPRRPNEFTGSIFEESSYGGKGFIDIGGIQFLINRYLRPGLPNIVNPKTQAHLCTRASQAWKEPMGVFFDKTHEIVNTHLLRLLFHHLGIYEQTQLYRTTEMHLKDFIDRFATEQKMDLDKLIARETQQSFTMNGKDVKKHEAEEKIGLLLGRKKIRARHWLQRQMRVEPKKWRVPPETTDEERKKIDAKRIDDIVKNEDLGADPFERELDVAAYVRGYYITAGTRFSDSVCLSIHASFFQDIRNNIRFHLEEKLGIDGPDGEEVCRRLMEEDDTIGRRRRELNAERKRLAGFSNRLARLVAQLSEPDVELAESINGVDEDFEDEEPISHRRSSNYQRPNIDDGDMTAVEDSMELDSPMV